MWAGCLRLGVGVDKNRGNHGWQDKHSQMMRGLREMARKQGWEQWQSVLAQVDITVTGEIKFRQNKRQHDQAAASEEAPSLADADKTRWMACGRIWIMIKYLDYANISTPALSSNLGQHCWDLCQYLAKLNIS